MKNVLLGSSVLLALSIPTAISRAAIAVAAYSLEVPAQDILKAAHKIVPQTAMNYAVEGSLSCWQDEYANEPGPPFVPQCLIEIAGQWAVVYNAERLIEKLPHYPEHFETAYSFTGKFSAKSYSDQANPQDLHEIAVISIH